MRALPWILLTTAALSLACAGGKDDRVDDSGPVDSEPEGTVESEVPEVWTSAWISFDNVSGAVTTQYDELATFSSEEGHQLITTTAGGFAVSEPNFVCTATGGTSLNCDRDIYVDFTHPVRSVRIWAVGCNTDGVIARARLLDGDTLLGEEDLIGDGDDADPELIDLSAYSGVTRLEIVEVSDAYGLGFDDLSFEWLQ
ncbi:MAG: hypothetical protein H6741_01565 [Alphaproteobacteria bacterium]|nr:hypothetical protein [Alphaproteobacteria bacterium]